MLSSLVRHDPLLTFLPRVIWLVPLLQLWFRSDGSNDITLPLILMLTVYPLQDLRVRLSEEQLALPVSARTWVAARLTVFLVHGLSICAVGLAVPLWFAGGAGERLAVLGRIGLMALTWSACVTTYFALRPARPRLPSWKPILTLAFLFLVLAVLGERVPRGFSLISLILLTGAGWVLWRRVPPTMFVDTEEEATGSTAVTFALRRPLRTLLLRRTVLHPLNVGLFFVIPVVLSLVWAQGGMQAAFFLLLPLWLVGMLNISRAVLVETGHLPIPPARLAPWILLPPLLALVAGLGLGETWARAEGAPSDPARPVSLLGLGLLLVLWVWFQSGLLALATTSVSEGGPRGWLRLVAIGIGIALPAWFVLPGLSPVGGLHLAEHLQQSLLGNPWLHAVLAVALFCLGYALLLRRFRRAEIPAQVLAFSRMPWGTR